MTFMEALGIELVCADENRAEARMEIRDEHRQPFGYLHGGVTLSLLETVASVVAEHNANLETEVPFGVEIKVRHVKPGVSGVVTGTADCIERSVSERSGARKLLFRVVAEDEQGDVVSEGTFACKVVSRDYLARKQRGDAAPGGAAAEPSRS